MTNFNKRYLIVKNKGEKTIKYMEYDPSDGYHIKPKGNVRLEDAINVDKMVLISPTLISKMINKKANKRINYLLKLINFIDSDDEQADDAIELALDQNARFKQEFFNQYKKHLSEEEAELLANKISIIDSELKLRKAYLEKDKIMNPEEEEYRRSR